MLNVIGLTDEMLNYAPCYTKDNTTLTLLGFSATLGPILLMDTQNKLR